MSEGDNKFTLRFFDNEITPRSFSAKELGNFIISLYEGLIELIDVRYPQVNLPDVRLNLVDIENRSESLTFAYSDQPEIGEAIKYYGNAVKSETYTDLPEKTFKSIKAIHSIIKGKTCKAELVQHGERLFVVTPGHKFIDQKNVLIKNNLVLYGELNKIGGDKLRAWVDLYDGSKIAFAINNEQLVLLRPLVKEPICINGEAKWNMLTKKVVSFKLKEIIFYTPFQVKEGFDKIKEVASGWDRLNTDDSIVRFLKGDA